MAQARALQAPGCHAVLIKGGHGSGNDAPTYLVDAAGVERFARPRIDTPHSHGTGCTLSAAIAALLASGRSPDGCRRPRQGLRVARAAAWPRAGRRHRQGAHRSSVRHSRQDRLRLERGARMLALSQHCCHVRARNGKNALLRPRKSASIARDMADGPPCGRLPSARLRNAGVFRRFGMKTFARFARQPPSWRDVLMGRFG